MDLGSIGSIVQAVLFAFFALLTAALAAIVGPTYDNLVVPEMQTGQLFPSLTSAAGGGPDYLVQASHFSSYLLVSVVDPLIALVAIGLGLAYLSRALWSSSGLWAEGLIARFVIAVVLANFAVPVAGGILGVAGAIYPVVAGWDGGAWQHWTNLAGYGEFSLSWQNGALAFVLAFVEFSVVLLLALMVGLRDATLAVLLVLLPLFTLLWPLKPLSPLARRAWLLFGELAFLPCVLVVPLELAVGSPNVIMLIAYLSLALASPFLLSLTGTHLPSLGFPSVGPALTGGVERGLLGASRSSSATFAGLGAGGGSASTGKAVDGLARNVGAVSLPASAPMLVADAIGRGASHLVRHIRAPKEDRPRFAPVKPGGGG
jgi:hypothetical protein